MGYKCPKIMSPETPTTTDPNIFDPDNDGISIIEDATPYGDLGDHFGDNNANGYRDDMEKIHEEFDWVKVISNDGDNWLNPIRKPLSNEEVSNLHKYLSKVELPNEYYTEQLSSSNPIHLNIFDDARIIKPAWAIPGKTDGKTNVVCINRDLLGDVDEYESYYFDKTKKSGTDISNTSFNNVDQIIEHEIAHVATNIEKRKSEPYKIDQFSTNVDGENRTYTNLSYGSRGSFTYTYSDDNTIGGKGSLGPMNEMSAVFLSVGKSDGTLPKNWDENDSVGNYGNFIHLFVNGLSEKVGEEVDINVLARFVNEAYSPNLKHAHDPYQEVTYRLAQEYGLDEKELLPEILKLFIESWHKGIYVTPDASSEKLVEKI